ncbi:hypothetical protein [Anaeromassilibacillus senegalensis]|uniref:hypothetical protein n=1 Tax=Anaeromassilibacillus senegalensis TaxID=1673717 RepID=UPI00067FADD9|nr:hypothetical protein [Anaeromassilibacillus senegalensis]
MKKRLLSLLLSMALVGTSLGLTPAAGAAETAGGARADPGGGRGGNGGRGACRCPCDGSTGG